MSLWYKPMSINDILDTKATSEQYDKCQIIGVIQSDGLQYFLKDIKLNRQVQVLVHKLTEVPSFIGPSGCRIFGNVHYNTTFNNDSESEVYSISRERIPSKNLAVIVADIMQFIPPKIIFKFTDLTYSIKNLEKFNKN